MKILNAPLTKGLLYLGSLSLSATALAHVSVTSDTGYANAYYQVDLAVPHGCGGTDTYRVEVEIPASLNSIRAVLGDLGYASVESDPDTGNTTKIIWEKPIDSLLDSDSHAYNLSFRTKLPDAPYTTLHFPTTQYCMDKDGVESNSAWIGTSGHGAHGGSGESSELPAPSLFIHPKRFAGWNEYTAPEHLHDLSIFEDAIIVWKDNAAYSANPNTQALIEADPDVDLLEAIHPGDTFWVKY